MSDLLKLYQKTAVRQRTELERLYVEYQQARKAERRDYRVTGLSELASEALADVLQGQDLKDYAVLEHDDPIDKGLVFEILARDFRYHGSGYNKEQALRWLRKAQVIKPNEAEFLRAVILDKIEHKALREFRDYCRLIPKIKTPEFVAKITELATNGTKWQSHRARLALRYMNWPAKDMYQVS